jgi:hypothetical protein
MVDSAGFMWGSYMNDGQLYRSQQIVPVTFLSFTASRQQERVLLRWSTAYESRNFGFSIERRSLNAGWKCIGFVPGAGNCASTLAYQFLDSSMIGDCATYRLRQIDVDGAEQYSSEVTIASVDAALEMLTLHGVSPSPAHGVAMLRFSLVTEGPTHIAVHDVLGRERLVLSDETISAGLHTLPFNTSALEAGYYTIIAVAGRMTTTRAFLVR